MINNTCDFFCIFQQGTEKTPSYHVVKGRFVRVDDHDDLKKLVKELKQLSPGHQDAVVKLSQAQVKWVAKLDREKMKNDRHTRHKEKLDEEEQEQLRVRERYLSKRNHLVDFLIRAFFYGRTYAAAASQERGAHYIAFTQCTVYTIISKIFDFLPVFNIEKKIS